MSEPVRDLARALRLFCAAHPVAAPFLTLWPHEDDEVRTVESRPLPVLAALAGLPKPNEPAAADVLRQLVALAPVLAWRQTYEAPTVGQNFLDRYGWTEIVGRHGPFACKTLAAGFLLLGPDILYPPHAHAAEEVYLPISGTADWLKDRSWSRQSPGGAIHHPPRVVHAMRTGAGPLLAFYLWRGAGLEQSAYVVP